MSNTTAIRTVAAVPMCSWVKALVKIHRNNGFDTKESVFDNLERAVAVYQVVQNRLNDNETFGVEPIVPGGCLSCPCCWEECQALNADGCMGLRHFRKVASQSKTIPPLEQATPFVPAAVVMDALKSRGVNGQGECG
jgi:hypothetical protein